MADIRRSCKCIVELWMRPSRRSLVKYGADDKKKLTLPRSPVQRLRPDKRRFIVNFAELETYEQTISLAHDENIQEWKDAISQYFVEQTHRSIPFLGLTKAIPERSEEAVGNL